MSHVDIVGTDFGVVRLTPRVTDWMDATAPGWREVVAKPARSRDSKRVKRARSQIKRMEAMVSAFAEMTFVTGGTLSKL